MVINECCEGHGRTPLLENNDYAVKVGCCVREGWGLDELGPRLRARSTSDRYGHLDPDSRPGQVIRALLTSAGRRYPLYQGCGRLANLPITVALSTLPEPVQQVTLRDGTLLRVRTDDFVGRALYYFGDFDRRLTWLLARVLRPGDTFVDIGANYGWLSLTAARLVGASGRVHAFEPQPGLASMLRESVQDAGASQVRVHEVALSDAAGELDLWVPAGVLGAASFSRRGDSGEHIRVGVEVAGVALHHLGLDRVRLVKIDVEGHEDAVMRGARDWLEDARVDAIVFEWNDPRPLAMSDTAAILGELGYDLYQVETRPFRPRITPVARGSHPANDFLALPPTSDDIRRLVVTPASSRRTILP